KTLLVVGEDRAVRLWDVTTGEPRGQPLRHDGQVLRAHLSPDGKLVATSSLDQAGVSTVSLWAVATGTSIGQPRREHGLGRESPFNPDGKVLLTIGPPDRKVW